MLLRTETFRNRSFPRDKYIYIITYTHKRFYTQTLLQLKPFTHETLLNPYSFTYKYFYTQILLHTDIFQTETFIHKHFYRQILLHTNIFTCFRGFTWTGHIIEAFSVGGGGIKWPFQVKMCFFRGFTWTGDFIEAFSVYLDWPLYRGILCWGRGYKVANPT